MRLHPAFLLLGCAILAHADLAFDLRQTVTGHPALVLKTAETTARIAISGGRIARTQHDFVRVDDYDGNIATLVDHQTRQFATTLLNEEFRRKWAVGCPVPLDRVRVASTSTGIPGEWNGTRIKRDVVTIEIPDAPGPGRMILTWDIAENLPGLELSKERLDSAEKRRDTEILAMINTLSVRDVDLLVSLSSARARLSPGIPLHSSMEFRAKKGSAVLDEIGQQFADKAIMTFEGEVENLSTDVDHAVFHVPAGYQKVDFDQLAHECFSRASR